MRLEIAHLIFCEDIRSEEGGKVSLMGLLGELVDAVAPPPLRMRLALHAMVRNPENETASFTLTLTLPGEEPMVTRDVLKSREGSTVHFLNWMFDGLTIREPGPISARLVVEAEPRCEQTALLEVRFPTP